MSHEKRGARTTRVGLALASMAFAIFAVVDANVLASFPVNEHATATCRSAAHESVFDLEESNAPIDTQDTTTSRTSSSLCARVLSTPRLRCVVAAASTRCRLGRAKILARGRCDESDDCETCVMHEIGRGARYEPRGPFTSDDDRDAFEYESSAFESLGDDTIGEDDFASKPSPKKPSRTSKEEFESPRRVFIHRTMEWQIYLQELDAVEQECRHLENTWRAETSARILRRVLDQSKRADAEARGRSREASETASEIRHQVESMKRTAARTRSRLDAMERSTNDLAHALETSKVSAEKFANAHGEALFVAGARLETVFELVSKLTEGVREVTSVVDRGFERVNRLFESFQEIRDALARRLAQMDRDARGWDSFSFKASASGVKRNVFAVIVEAASLAAAIATPRLVRIVASVIRGTTSAVYHGIIRNKALSLRTRGSLVLAFVAVARRVFRGSSGRRGRSPRENRSRGLNDAERDDIVRGLRDEIRALRRETAGFGLFEPRRGVPRVRDRKEANRDGARSEDWTLEANDADDAKPLRVGEPRPPRRTSARRRDE